MRLLEVLSITVVFPILGCGGRDAVTPKADPPPTHARIKDAPIEFDAIYERVEAFKTHDLDHFATNWPAVRKELEHHAKNGGFATLSKQQQEKLWWSLEYLRGCRHPDILHNHGAEIVPILFALDVPEYNKHLKHILAQDD